MELYETLRSGREVCEDKEKASRLVFWCAVRVTDGFEVRVGLCFVCYVDGQFDG